MRSRLPDDLRFRYISLRAILQGLAFPMAIAALGLGATLIGAEWGAGTVSTWLTWEPRRLRVMLAKIAGLIVAVVAVSTFAQVAFALGLLPAAFIRGTMAGMDAAWWADLATTALRSDAAAVVLALFGFSIANMLRNTTAAAGAAIAYLVVGEPLLSTAAESLRGWLLFPNVTKFIEWTEVPGMPGRSPAQAGLLVGGYSLGFILLSLVIFRLRDVT